MKEALKYGGFVTLQDDITPVEVEKPPLGLMPRRMHDLKRMQAIDEAIRRYTERRMVIPLEWVEEYNQLCAVVNGKGHLREATKMVDEDPRLYVTHKQMWELKCDERYEGLHMYPKDYPPVEGEEGRMRTNKGYVRFVLQD